MTERKTIDWLKKHVPVLKGKGVVLGIGDDCAVFRQRGAQQDLLFTTDLMIENVHFRGDWKPELIGHRALTRGLSDLAAGGGVPRFCLVSLAVPKWATNAWLKRFYSGLLELATRSGTVLAGGDLSRSEQVVCDIVVCGAVPVGEALRRDGARPGHGIYVSGPLGASAVKLHRKPEPQLALGQSLRGIASAAIDISDGLSIDLERLCEASGTAAELDGAIPVAKGATLEQALHFGDDYELLFTGRALEVPGATRVGTIRKGPPGTITFQGARLKARGWDHFA